MAAPTPMGKEKASVIRTTQSDPSRAVRIPAIAGSGDCGLTTKSHESQDRNSSSAPGYFSAAYASTSSRLNTDEKKDQVPTMVGSTTRSTTSASTWEWLRAGR